MSLDSREDSSTAFNVYTERLQDLAQRKTAGERHGRALGYAKLVIGLLIIVLAVSLIHHPVALSLLLIPAAVFVVLAVMHEKLLESLRLRARIMTFYERGLARLTEAWQGAGETGERFLDPLHPYARDLDIFGKASLFELLCTARTRAGEETLARWLLAPAPVDEILARQAAVRELAERVDFREQLFTRGDSVRLGVQPEALSDWGEGHPAFASKLPLIVSCVLAILWLASFVCWAVWDQGIVVLLVSLLNLAVYCRWRGRVKQATASVEKAAEDLQLLADTLSLLESERVASPRLAQIQAVLKSEGTPPSAAIRKLATIARYLAQQHNMFCLIFDYFTFWSVDLVFAAQRWQRRFGPVIRGWLEAVGEFEALAALSGFAYERPEYVFPEFVREGPLFEAEAFAHPLLPMAKAVTNDLRLGEGLRLMILSGPNMAGKSTFIRGVGVSAVLAQCGAPVRARRLQLSPLNVAASICVLDSLAGGMSRFYVEIHHVKLIADLTRGSIPVLFLLDELLSGTNSHDRLVGTRYVVRSLLGRRAIGIVSTHDLALTEIPETIGEDAVNCHFEDRLGEGELIFDYKLKPGVVKTSNALELMRSIGIEVQG